MRYEVRYISTGDMDTPALGDVIAETDSATEAKQIAEREASAYYYGTAIRDTQTLITDCGDESYPDSYFTAIA